MFLQMWTAVFHADPVPSLLGEEVDSVVVFNYVEVAHFGGDDGVSERPLPLAGCASLCAACGRACVGSLRERSAPFEVPPDAG